MMWSHHVQLKINKATKVLNLIEHTLHKCTKEVKEAAYLRPAFECAAIVWDLHQKYLLGNIKKIPARLVPMVKQCL